ncbi:MAG: hypothetical protein AB1762_02645 [Gemmatimonadota bacterium]
MLRSIQLGSVALFLVLAGCTSDSITEVPAPQACYTLTLGAWSPELPEQLPPPPTAVQLTDSLGTSVLENGNRVVRSIPAGAPKAYPFQYWVPRERGDVFIVFSNGFTGMTMDLAPQGEDLSGTAHAFFDFGNFDVSAPVQLQRASCS